MDKSSSRFQVSGGTVYIVGAGPGAPDLIAVRGRDIIEQADLILYADSLVEQSVAEIARKPGARIVASSSLHLGEIMDLMVETAKAGGVVARVHSGDPALYGATHEQMAHLDDHDIPYEIVPGITAAFAAAALLKTELTVPDVVQTIILTRTAGRTTMPEGEELRALAAPGASLAIYLSVTRMRHVIDDLLASGGYTPETPVAVLHKVTWPDESYVTGTLADIVDKVRAAGYTKHALILVSPALDPALKGADRRTSSHLYDSSYTHRFRKAENFRRGKERTEAAGKVTGVVAGEKHLGATVSRAGTAIISITHNGTALATKLASALDADLAIPLKFQDVVSTPASHIPRPYSDSALDEIRRRWPRYARLVLVMPSGVAVRAIAPLLSNKQNDPAVVCLDEAGSSVIPLIGGHQAGANALAEQIARITEGHAAITTASDVQGKPALDLIGQADGWRTDPISALTHASATLVNGETVGVFVDPALTSARAEIGEWLAETENCVFIDSLDELDVDAYQAALIISHRVLSDHHKHLLQKGVLYRPPALVVGMGCKRGVPASELKTALDTALSDAELAVESIALLATADLKEDEAGLQALAAELNVPLKIVSSEELRTLEPAGFSPSAAQEKFDLPGVAEPCALVVADGGELLLPKRSFERCTVAVALVDF